MIDTRHCAGCKDDFYNGHNDIGVSVCWKRATATLEPSLLIHVDREPPYLGMKPQGRPTCYKMPRHVTVKPEAIGADGYWK